MLYLQVFINVNKILHILVIEVVLIIRVLLDIRPFKGDIITSVVIFYILYRKKRIMTTHFR